jgi:hypothetical protein
MMHIFTDWREALRDESRLTLQVPELSLSFGGDDEDDEPEEMEEVPQDWFWYLREDIPAVGRQSGFLHISPIGYAANKAALAKAYIDGSHDGQRGLDSCLGKWSKSLDPKYVVMEDWGPQEDGGRLIVPVLALTEEAFDAWAQEHFSRVHKKMLKRIASPSCPQGHVLELKSLVEKFFPAVK